LLPQQQEQSSPHKMSLFAGTSFLAGPTKKTDDSARQGGHGTPSTTTSSNGNDVVNVGDGVTTSSLVATNAGSGQETSQKSTGGEGPGSTLCLGRLFFRFLTV
jgi:hypothetical protein